MYKQLASKGTTLNKNLVNTESLTLNNLSVTEDVTIENSLMCTNLEVSNDLTVHFVNAEAISTPELTAECSELTLPLSAPTIAREGSICVSVNKTVTPHVVTLHICDSAAWISAELV